MYDYCYYFICICCFAEFAATRHASDVYCVQNGAFCAHKQCKAELKGLCQPQLLLYNGGGSDDDISIFFLLVHGSSLQNKERFLGKQK